MNWKFWETRKDLAAAKEANRVLEIKLSLARRAIAKTREQGMGDEEMAEAFTHLMENKGWTAILQLLTDAELSAVDRMTEDGANFAAMKKAAGAVEALTHFHHRLVELEAEAKARAKKAA